MYWIVNTNPGHSFVRVLTHIALHVLLFMRQGVWRSEDRFQLPVLSFPLHIGSRNRTQAIRFLKQVLITHWAILPAPSPDICANKPHVHRNKPLKPKPLLHRWRQWIGAKNCGKSLLLSVYPLSIEVSRHFIGNLIAWSHNHEVCVGFGPGRKLSRESSYMQLLEI